MEFILQACKVTCPDCGGQSYIKEWEPGKCPHCGVDLSYFADGLKAESVDITILVDQLTGQAMVM